MKQICKDDLIQLTIGYLTSHDYNVLKQIDVSKKNTIRDAIFNEKLFGEPLINNKHLSQCIENFILESNKHCDNVKRYPINEIMFEIHGINNDITIFKEDYVLIPSFYTYLYKLVKKIWRNKVVLDEDSKLELCDFVKNYNSKTNNQFINLNSDNCSFYGSLLPYFLIIDHNTYKISTIPERYFIKYNNSYGFELSSNEFNDLNLLLDNAMENMKNIAFKEEFKYLNNNE